MALHVESILLKLWGAGESASCSAGLLKLSKLADSS